ncbi:hypothetical protein [Methylorubrum sp. SB2]|uniref:hypothetical protein n=1 Tax=Methylorubrum subtropicum TaxID=3138812 RepID=UPI00313C75B3
MRIWCRKLRLYGSAGPAPLGATPPRIGPQRQAPQRPKVSALPELHVDDLERLWSHVELHGPNECWPWTAAKSSKGYGRFKVAGKLYSPHRLIYAQYREPIVNVQERHGSVVMHSCDNPACCNPKHLSLGRQVENVADMIAKGRGGWRRSSSTAADKSEASHAV